MNEVKSESSSLSFDDDGVEPQKLIDADGQVPPPAPKEIPKEEEKPKPPPTSVSTPIKPQSKPINKYRNRDLLEKIYSQTPDRLEKVNKLRK